MSKILKVVLLLVSTVANGARVDFKVEKPLPNIDPILMQSEWYSGSYEVSRTRQIHFLMIESLYKKETDPVIIYLNDGPGYAAVSSALNGLGPVYFNPLNQSFIRLYNNWCNNATVIFVDAPPGTGFSKAGRDIDTVGNDLHFEREATSFVK